MFKITNTKRPLAISALNKEEMKNLVEEIGKIAKLPQREDPSVATVTDISKLKDQPVFAESKNGDRVLLYTNAQKVVIYDPISRKIVNIAPLTAGNARAVNNTIVPSASSVPTAIPAASVQNQALANVWKITLNETGKIPAFGRRE